MDILNYRRGIARISFVAYIPLAFYIVASASSEAKNVRPDYSMIVLELIGAAVMVGMGALGLIVAWLLVIWIVDGFQGRISN